VIEDPEAFLEQHRRQHTNIPKPRSEWWHRMSNGPISGAPSP
jgi:hypothetical protein